MSQTDGDLQAFCLFMGYTRSGHSLIGAFLDAHPDSIVAHSSKIFEYDEHKALTGRLSYSTREDLIAALLHQSQRQTAGGRRGGTRLINGVPERVSYAVPGGHQGTYDRLRVVGNKAGQESPMVWQCNPRVFDEIEELVGAPVRFLHVYRNPWDNIASMGRVHEDKAPKRYFRRAQIVQKFKAEGTQPVLDVRFESVVADPLPQLRTIFEFYGLDASDDLIEACASVIAPEPNPSRRTRDWNPGEVRWIANMMQEFEWLQGYPDTPD